MEIAVAKIKQIYCNTCKGNTNHEIKASHNRSDCEEDQFGYIDFTEYYQLTEYYFLVCRGCSTATLEEKSTSAGMTDDNGDDFYSYYYYPKRKRKDFRQREAKHFSHVDKKLIKTYKEIITAFQQELDIITAMGVRALLEGICVLEGINDKKMWGLAEKIGHLSDVSKISISVIEGLKRITFIGNDAAHRLTPPDQLELSLSIDLLESLMMHMYEGKLDLEYRAKLLEATRNQATNY